MKTKRTLRYKPSPKQKLTYWYVAGGIALALLGGIGLFLYLNLGSTEDSKAAGADFSSVTNGYWSDGSTWAGGINPATNNISSDIEIFEFVTRSGDLSYASGSSKTLIITDTLLIVGSLSMGNKSNVTINDGGVLIVTGDFSADNKITVGNGGVIVVGGNVSFPSSNQDSYTESGSGSGLYVAGDVSGNGDAASAEKEINDLETEFPEIYEVFAESIGTLPITLVYFKAKSQGRQVEISWKTAEEINNDFFTVERSGDGLGFEKIATVPGAGNSQQPKVYSYIDKYPLEGISYYRLTQTDFDLKFERFQAVAVSRQTFSVSSPQPIINKVVPNPFVESFRVEYEMPSLGSVRIQLMDFNGTIILSEMVEANSGQNQYQFEGGDRIKQGTYLLVVTANQYSSEPVRIMKL